MEEHNRRLEAEIHKMKLSNEAMFQLIKRTVKDVELMKAKVDTFIDETNEICSIQDMVSRINILENKLIRLSAIVPTSGEVDKQFSLSIS